MITLFLLMLIYRRRRKKKNIKKIFVRYLELWCYAMLYEFFFPKRKPTIFRGSPLLFLEPGLVLALGCGSVLQLFRRAVLGFRTGFGLLAGLWLGLALCAVPCWVSTLILILKNFANIVRLYSDNIYEFNV